jgi:hypothetical protein
MNVGILESGQGLALLLVERDRRFSDQARRNLEPVPGRADLAIDVNRVIEQESVDDLLEQRADRVGLRLQLAEQSLVVVK